MPDGTPFTLGTRTEPKATEAGIKPGHHPTAHCTDRGEIRKRKCRFDSGSFAEAWKDGGRCDSGKCR